MSSRSAKRTLYENYKKLYNSIQGSKEKSNFQETGTLTPKEFIEAGDALVQKIPMWQWASAAENDAPFLPPNKKYLILRGAPSYERAPTDDEKVNEAIDDDGWVATHIDHVPKAKVVDQATKEIDWEASDDDAVAEEEPSERKCRLYNVYIVYDQYYQTPRVFLIGYSENDHSKPLTKEEMMMDVYATNREKTVSIDPHPFLKADCISIHPCRHAETMKRTLDNLKERLEDAQIEEGVPESQRDAFVFPTFLALFVFLKFIASVVPTIEYDVSIDLDM
jgi:ubiquitin-like-conjugating enzyme ATG3